jgi:hypothetical protein
MTRHMTGTRKEWLTARLELLEAEKELTRRSDELAQRRQELPSPTTSWCLTSLTLTHERVRFRQIGTLQMLGDDGLEAF